MATIPKPAVTRTKRSVRLRFTLFNSKPKSWLRAYKDLFSSIQQKFAGFLESNCSCESLNSSNVSSDNQVVDIVRTFVGFDRFKVGHMAHDWVFI